MFHRKEIEPSQASTTDPYQQTLAETARRLATGGQAVDILAGRIALLEPHDDLSAVQRFPHRRMESVVSWTIDPAAEQDPADNSLYHLVRGVRTLRVGRRADDVAITADFTIANASASDEYELRLQRRPGQNAQFFQRTPDVEYSGSALGNHGVMIPDIDAEVRIVGMFLRAVDNGGAQRRELSA